METKTENIANSIASLCIVFGYANVSKDKASIRGKVVIPFRKKETFYNCNTCDIKRYVYDFICNNVVDFYSYHGENIVMANYNHFNNILTLRMGSTLEITPWIRGWGPDVEVMEPQGLREEFAEYARRLHLTYCE